MENLTNTSNERLNIRRTAHLVYLLQTGFFLTGISLIIAFVVNLFQHKQAEGTEYEDHFSWQMQTFKYMAGLIIIPFLLIIAIIYIGISATGGEEFRTVYELFGTPAVVVANIYAAGVAVFLIYRIYKGWKALISEERAVV